MCEDKVTTGNNSKNKKNGDGPKYKLNIEGVEFNRESAEITTEEIAMLGGWSISEGVIMIDKDGNERTLKEGEIITLKPGMAFAKKVIFKRG